MATCRNSYHGGSPFAMELTNLSTWKFPLPRPLGTVAVSECFIVLIFSDLYHVLLNLRL